MKKTLLLTIMSFFSLTQIVFSQNILENKYDVKEYILDLNIGNYSTEISGNVTINAKVTASSLDTFVVDLIDTTVVGQTFMVVDSVFVNGVFTVFQHHDDLVFMPLATAIPQNQLFSVQIYYHGNGTANSSVGYNGILKFNYAGVKHTCTMSEPTWAKVWWPCKQVLEDKADSVTFYITTDSANKSGSNGILKSSEALAGGKVKYKWQTKYPIDFYLISFSVGPFQEYVTYAPLENGQDSVLLYNLLFPNSNYYQAHLKAINKTKQLLNCYSNLIGTYPFKDEKYGYSVIGTNFAGMEHQTMCTMGYISMDTTYGDMYWWVAHELGHQWFGDYVTCAAWNDIWLNEGFASYMEYVALQNFEPQSRADLWMNDAHNIAKSQPGGSVYVPVVVKDVNFFSYELHYKKGPSIIHTLRYEINNDSLFFSVLKNYLSTYAYSVATGEDFKQVAESTTGMDFTVFFDQWYYGEGYPSFNVNWGQNGDTLTIISIQTTSTSITPLFKTHFDVKLKSVAGDTILRLYQGSNSETFKMYFPKTITSIVVDPNLWLIQKNLINVGIDEISKSLSFSLFPIPANDKINLIISQIESVKNPVVSVYNVQGQILLQQKISQEKTELDINGLPKGVYILKMNNNDRTEVTRMVKD